MASEELTIELKLSELRHIRDTLVLFRYQDVPRLRELWAQVAGLYQRKKKEAEAKLWSSEK